MKKVKNKNKNHELQRLFQDQRNSTFKETADVL